MNEVASQTLYVVSKELGTTLSDARQALENYAEREDQLPELARCAELLHEVHGVLRLVEVYGASLLAEEMEQVARYLFETADDRKQHAEGLDALLRSMVQLPAYLERVLGGGRDLALVLLPLLNDLRAVRGSALLSEGTLLLLNLTSDRQPQPLMPQAGEPPMSVSQWARRLRSRFQVGLLGWIRGERREQNLEILAAVAEKLEQIATRQPVFQLWWVVGAIIEAIKEQGLDGNATINRLLGHADRELKRLYEIGETRYAETPAVELLNNLLYYVARATSNGPRVNAVRASFKLQELLPVDAEVQQERENLSAPSVKLMKTVAAAIKEDLSRVKDVLDIFMRKGGSQVEELGTQVEMLKKISDTLGVLGLGSLRQRVQDEITRLNDLVAHRSPVSDTVLVDIAATLISVEDNLDDQLVRLIMPVLPAGSGLAAEGEDSEFRVVQQAVLRECIVNLARIKEAIAATIARQPEFSGADAVPALSRGITAGLLMLGKARAVEIMESVSGYIEEVLRPGAQVPSGRLERLADAIVSVEYYMETLQSGRSDPWYMLDNADICLAALREAPALPVETPVVASDSGYARTLQINVPPGDVPVPTATFSGTATDASISVPPLTPPAPEPNESNAEFRALFLEEAREELPIINEYFPAWDENPGDQESLVRVRRSFHTLKGSGRMVGAKTIGEFAWAIENLLNRLINGTLQRSPGSLGLLRQAVAVLPDLVEQLATGKPSIADVGLIIARAQAIAEGRDPETAVAVALPAEPEIALPVAEVVVGAPVEPVAPPPELPAIEATAIVAALPPIEATAIIAALPENFVPADSAYLETEVLPPGEAVDAPRLSFEDLFSDPAEGVDSGSAPAEPAVPEFAATEILTPALPMMLEPPSSRFVRYAAEPEDAGAAPKVPAMPPPPPRSIQPAPEPSEGPDLMLVEIYRAETASHVATVREFLKNCVGKFAPYPVTEALHRACHTLSGASKMAEARHSIRIAEPLNLYIRKLYDHGLGLPEAGRRMLGDAVDAMEHVAAHIDEATSFFTAHSDIVARLKWLDGDADKQIAANGLQPQERSIDVSLAPAPFEELISADALMTQAPTPIPVVPPPPVSHATETPALRPVPVPEPPATQDADEFDAEIAAIFCEEATELLEVAEGTLQKFRADPATNDPLTELQRVLHTLKGGARMAGIRAMGDLSHELESLLIQVTSGLVENDQRTMEVLQASLDELSRMRDTVSGGRRVAPARDLVTRIKALGRGGPVPPVLKAVAPEQSMPTPAIAPAPPAAPIVPPVVTDIAATSRETRVLVMPEPTTPPPVMPLVPPPVDPVWTAAAASAPEVIEPTDTPSLGEIEAEPVEVPVTRFVSAARHDEPAAPLEPAKPAVAEGEVPALEESRSIALPPGREPGPAPEPRELARVDADLLDMLLNSAGEVSIFRARIEQQLSSIEFNVTELSRVTARVKEQLRRLELETEAQILHKHHEDYTRRGDFDPLELDQYSSIQQYSRALAESASDVASVQGLLETLSREAQNLLMQQARVVTELQNGLMRTRMVPFQRHVQRLSRIVRQVANETHKNAEFIVTGASGELDRQVLERMLPPFEHMLRNAVVHGIESPAERTAKGKNPAGRIEVQLRREGSEVVITVADDGAGMNLRAIREKAVTLGMIDPQQALTDEQAMQLVLEPGFSTAASITQAAGRGVGMDVVATEIKKLGGALYMESTPEKGTRFNIRLPFTLAISQALIVRVGDEMYAVPLPTVEGVVRVPRSEVQRHLQEESPTFDYGNQKYRFQHLGLFVGAGAAQLPEQELALPVILVRAGEHSTALVVDELVGSREIVVKSLGPQIAGIRGIAGATILGDGRIVIILDVGSLVRSEWRARPAADTLMPRGDRRTFALVVDDSITVRRVTQRLLERNGMRVVTAKDGLDALQVLQEHMPDVILLDIEMPRMDGYEVAAQLRSDPRLKHIPIVMITSRVGEKHRARAIELGVDDYLGKPYQENQLLDAIEPLVRSRREAAS